jgi:hypothetical protein
MWNSVTNKANTIELIIGFEKEFQNDGNSHCTEILILLEWTKNNLKRFIIHTLK